MSSIHTFLQPLSYIFKANVDVRIGDDECIKNMEVAKLRMKIPMRKTMRRSEDNIKKILEFEGVHWIQLDRDRVHRDS